jgi:hypothetical protein
MTQMEALQKHRQLCNELYQLALEENQFLKANQRLPDPLLLGRKRQLLDRLSESLAALRAAPPESPGAPARREAIEKARERILQILHLDRENEQLLLRFSLGRFHPAVPAPAASVAQLQKLYERHV